MLPTGIHNVISQLHPPIHISLICSSDIRKVWVRHGEGEPVRGGREGGRPIRSMKHSTVTKAEDVHQSDKLPPLGAPRLVNIARNPQGGDFPAVLWALPLSTTLVNYWAVCLVLIPD